MDKDRRSGTTLVELLVALALVGIFSASLLNAILSGAQRIEDARWRAKALMLATTKIEELCARTRAGSLVAELGVKVSTDPRVDGVGPFQITQTVTTMPVDIKLFRVVVEVEFTPGRGSPKSLKLEAWVDDEEN